MKNVVKILTVVAILLSGNLVAQDSLQIKKQNKFQYQKQSMAAGQATTKSGFIDLNGDGFNDNALDADGDGIPNGQDADYTGAKARKGHGAKGFVDLDGDGINDNALDADGDGIPNGQDPDFVKPLDGSGAGHGYGNGQGGGNGSGSGSGTGVCDGTGTGSGIATGTGNCDGTGPKGKKMGGRK
ncbi:MAG: hypothetical protein K9H64_19745 [Bacteroidales bacterium]|nr:hypothetical protein [Bacteroidales bacterium]MCF8458304.1 hypothetical protein [Bacteroidales bacterium]